MNSSSFEMVLSLPNVQPSPENPPMDINSVGSVEKMLTLSDDPIKLTGTEPCLSSGRPLPLLP